MLQQCVTEEAPVKIEWSETLAHGSLAETECQYWGIDKTSSARQMCGIYKSTLLIIYIVISSDRLILDQHNII